MVLDGFCAYFADKQLDSGTEVTLLRRPGEPPLRGEAPGPSCRLARCWLACSACARQRSLRLLTANLARLPSLPAADGAIDVCLRAPGDESPYASVRQRLLCMFLPPDPTLLAPCLLPWQ